MHRTLPPVQLCMKYFFPISLFRPLSVFPPLLFFRVDSDALRTSRAYAVHERKRNLRARGFVFFVLSRSVIFHLSLLGNISHSGSPYLRTKGPDHSFCFPVDSVTFFFFFFYPPADGEK